MYLHNCDISLSACNIELFLRHLLLLLLSCDENYINCANKVSIKITTVTLYIVFYNAILGHTGSCAPLLWCGIQESHCYYTE